MQLKNVSEDPAMLQSFLAKAAVNPLEAVRELRAAGYRVNPSAIPTPALTRRQDMTARGVNPSIVNRFAGGPEANAEREALRMASAIWNGEKEPLAGLSVADQVAAIMADRSGLTPLDAYNHLLALDEGPQASLFKRLHLAEIVREEATREEAGPSLAQLATEEAVALERVRVAHASALLSDEELAVARDALAREFAAKRVAIEAGATLEEVR
jgi:hypothetical protein